MSPLRRILFAGLPAAGLTVAASLALAGSPATAMEDHAVRPVLVVTPCTQADRDNCDYGTPGGAGTATTGGGDTAGPPAVVATAPTRGHGGYGTTSPTPTTPATTKPSPAPSTTTPTGNVATTPPSTTPTSPGVSIQGSETPAPAPSVSGGVSAGHALPVTGAPMGAIVTLGALMVAGGAASVWYTRRRRSA